MIYKKAISKGWLLFYLSFLLIRTKIYPPLAQVLKPRHSMAVTCAFNQTLINLNFQNQIKKFDKNFTLPNAFILSIECTSDAAHNNAPVGGRSLK